MKIVFSETELRALSKFCNRVQPENLEFSLYGVEKSDALQAFKKIEDQIVNFENSNKWPNF